MSSITLVGPITEFYEGAEQRYVVVKPYKGQWVIAEYGCKRWGPGMDLKYEFEFDPEFAPAEDEDQWGWNITHGYHRVYNNEAEYLAECSIPSEELVDGFPNRSWTVACLLN
jgi:starvation-inducible outer membrane lipoprotein